MKRLSLFPVHFALRGARSFLSGFGPGERALCRFRANPHTRLPRLFCTAPLPGAAPFCRITAALLLLASCEPARAAGGMGDATGNVPEGVSEWMGAFAFLLGIVCGLIWIVKQFRPSPALHRQFAPIDHVHTDLVTRPEMRDELNRVQKELTTRLEEGATRDARSDEKLDQLGKKISEGFSNTHRRIDPMAEALAVTSAALKQHLEDHRADKIAAHNPQP